MVTKLKQCARRLGSWPSPPAVTGHNASAASLSRGLFAALAAVFTLAAGSANAAHWIGAGGVVISGLTATDTANGFAVQATDTFPPPNGGLAYTLTYGQTLASIVLPAGYAFNAPKTMPNVGPGQSFPATYTNPDGNHAPVTGDITVNVAKRVVTMLEPGSYEFPYFPEVIYAELLNQYAGTYKPEQYADVDWATRQTVVTLNDQYTLYARLVPLGDGTARIILNEALSLFAVAPFPYNQTNCVVLAGNPATVSDPPNQVGNADTKVRVYRKPVIDLNDTLNPDTDNPDGDDVIGTFTPPADGGYDGDVLPLNGEIPVLFKIYRYDGNAPAGEDPDSAYVDTEYKGYVVNRGDAAGYRICLIDPLPIIPPGTWYLGIATDDSRLAVGEVQRSFRRYAFTVDMARIGLTGAVTAQETGPVFIGTYTPNPDYGFGDWTAFDVVITINGTDYAGYIDSSRRVYINDANFASLAPGSYTIRVVAGGLFEDGDRYTVAITESRVPFGEEEPDGDDGIDVIDPGVGAGLTITNIRVYQDGGKDWVDIKVSGCKNYSKDYALFRTNELIGVYGTDDEVRSDGLTARESSVGASLRYSPSKAEIIGLGALQPATNANGDWTFTFPKPPGDNPFYHAREVPR